MNGVNGEADSLNDMSDNQRRLDAISPNKQVSTANYLSLLKADRPNIKPDGFNFDVNEFENLCDVWTPKELFPSLLNCTMGTLDAFCNKIYHMNFEQTYVILISLADLAGRRAMRNLAFAGNNTALKLVAEHYMGLKENDENNASPSITIVNDLGNSKNKK